MRILFQISLGGVFLKANGHVKHLTNARLKYPSFCFVRAYCFLPSMQIDRDSLASNALWVWIVCLALQCVAIHYTTYILRWVVLFFCICTMYHRYFSPL